MNKVNCKQMTVGTWVFIYILLLSVTADELRVPRPHLHKLVLLMLCNVFVSMDHAIQITNTTEFVIALCRKLVCQMGYLTNFYCILWCILRMHTDCLQCISTLYFIFYNERIYTSVQKCRKLGHYAKCITHAMTNVLYNISFALIKQGQGVTHSHHLNQYIPFLK